MTTTSSQENAWAVWMRAAMTGDAGAYRQLLVSRVHMSGLWRAPGIGGWAPSRARCIAR
jgi:hypothetical protein